MIRRAISALLRAIPYAIGWLVGVMVLVAVIVWLALCDGYVRGRGLP